MSATQDAPGDTSPGPPPDAPADADDVAGRAARRAERVAALAFMVEACKSLAGPARDEAEAGDKQAGAFLISLAREIRQSVALMERIDPTALPKPRAPKPGPQAAPPAPGPQPGVIYSEGYFDGYTPPPPWTEPTEPWRVEDPRKQHVRECVRLVAVGASLTDEQLAELYVALEARLDAPDIAADIAEGREEVLLVSEICEDLGVRMNRHRSWPMPPPWGPEQPLGTPRTKLRIQAARDPPEAAGG